MSHWWIRVVLLVLSFWWPGWARAQEAHPKVLRCVLDGTVDAGSAAHFKECVRVAEEQGLAAVIFRIDTPGGSLESTRELVQAFLAAKVPVLTWVGPSGARAGSAGVFLVLASHVAAMAPASNIGAAHPVLGPTGADPKEAGDAMAKKVVNDTVAFAESIAKQRGRNERWAAEAVRESASVTGERAVELKVVDHLAASEDEALRLAHGKRVTTPDGERVVDTAGAAVTEHTWSLRNRLVHGLSNPSLAYILFLVGGLGLAVELSHPGMIVPGVLGLSCMVLALVAFSAMPVQLGAVALMLIGAGLLVGELFVTSGLLAVGGGALFALGGVLLVDRFDPSWFVEPTFQVPLRTVLPTAISIALMGGFLAWRAGEARALPQRTGDLGLLGEIGQTQTDVGPSGGAVFVHGERWSARSRDSIPAGAKVAVRAVVGLVLEVEEVRS